MKRKRRSKAEWISICAAYESSGESAAAFARRRGIQQGTLSWWRAKLKQEGHQAKRSAAFVEVVNERLETSPRVVVLVGTVTIEFSGKVPPASWIAELDAREGIGQAGKTMGNKDVRPVEQEEPSYPPGEPPDTAFQQSGRARFRGTPPLPEAHGDLSIPTCGIVPQPSIPGSEQMVPLGVGRRPGGGRSAPFWVAIGLVLLVAGGAIGYWLLVA